MLQLFNSDHESDSVRKYDNLNLNQQSAKRFDHIFEGNSGPHNNFLDKQSKRPSKLFGLLNLNEDKKKNDEKKGCDSPNTNNNTLSIHIAAFENCVEVYRVNVEEKLNPWQVDKRLSVMASVSFQNPFEFSRQQENKKVPDPEISQFKSLQKLFNPNVPIPKRRDEEPSTNEPLQKKIKKGECLSNITPKRDTTNNSLRDLGKLILSSPSTSAPHVQIVNNNPASPQNNATEKIKTEKDQNTIAVLRKGLDAYEQKLNTLEEEKKVLNEKLTRSRMDVQKQKKQIERITEKKLLEDVEHNLRYHKLILKTTSSNSKLFTITSGGQAKTLSTLIENLSALITTANQNTTEDDDQDDNEY